MAGPGNVVGSFEAFRDGKLNQRILHVGYSDQFFHVCRELEVPLLTLTTHRHPEPVEYGDLRVESIPDPFAGTSGLRYQAAHAALAGTIIARARQFKANVVVVSTEPYPLLLQPLKLLGARLVLTMHCTLWPQWKPTSTLTQLLRRTQWPFYRTFDAILSASRLCSDQIREVTRAPPPIVEFLPQMRGEVFDGIAPPDAHAEQFRVIFVGRVEADKGVFHLLEIAERARAAGRTNIAFDICGDGSALPELRRRVAEAGLSSVQLHGWCDAERLRAAFSRAHLSIVPTTADFVEGFNQVVVESLLAGRPVVTSKVCPAVDYVRPGIVVVPPDDVDAYTRAILQLADDRARFAALQEACTPVSRKFLDPRLAYAAALRRTLLALRANQTPEPLEVPFEA
jgi:glycosyltransferase involved in cell wall biosynthesis